MTESDYNELLSGAVDLATDLLAAHSEFSPFGLGMRDADNELMHLAPEQEGDGEFDPSDMLTILEDGLREAALDGTYRATAICSDVTLQDDDGDAVTAAILIAMEHVNAEPVRCLVPYTIGKETVELGDLAWEPGETSVFLEQVEN